MLKTLYDIRFFFFVVNFEEYHSNITLKTIHAMKYLMEKSNGSVINLPQFVMKTDDDIYLNIPNLVQMLRNIPQLK